MSEGELSLMMEDFEGDLGLMEEGGIGGLSSLDELVDILGIRESGPQGRTTSAEMQIWRHTFGTEDKWPI